MKEDTRKIIKQAIEYSKRGWIAAEDRLSTIRGILLAALEIEDKN